MNTNFKRLIGGAALTMAALAGLTGTQPASAATLRRAEAAPVFANTNETRQQQIDERKAEHAKAVELSARRNKQLQANGAAWKNGAIEQRREEHAKAVELSARRNKQLQANGAAWKREAIEQRREEHAKAVALSAERNRRLLAAEEARKQHKK